MKGGITSGVVYPHAVCEPATTCRLRDVGETFAGAIAAAAAAAAEYGRAVGGYDGGPGADGGTGHRLDRRDLQLVLVEAEDGTARVQTGSGTSA